MQELRDAFDADDVPRKNRALRIGHDRIAVLERADMTLEPRMWIDNCGKCNGGKSMPGSQEHIDRFYFAHGKCCAGCDWWRHINSVAGMCSRTPVEVHTTRKHLCGEFRDEFDWSSLPPNYRRLVGDPDAPQRK